MSKLQAAAWNRCWSPKVFRTAFRLDRMLTEQGGTLELRADQLRGLTDRVKTHKALEELRQACEALGITLLEAPDGSTWTIEQMPGTLPQAVNA